MVEVYLTTDPDPQGHKLSLCSHDTEPYPVKTGFLTIRVTSKRLICATRDRDTHLYLSYMEACR